MKAQEPPRGPCLPTTSTEDLSDFTLQHPQTISPAGSYFTGALVELHARIKADTTDPNHAALAAGTAKPSILFLSTTDAFGAAVCAGSIIHANTIGWDIVHKNATNATQGLVYTFEYVSGKNTDFSPVIKIAKQYRPHVVAICGQREDSALILPLLKASNLNVRALMATHAGRALIDKIGLRMGQELFSPTQWHIDVAKVGISTSPR